MTPPRHDNAVILVSPEVHYSQFSPVMLLKASCTSCSWTSRTQAREFADSLGQTHLDLMDKEEHDRA